MAGKQRSPDMAVTPSSRHSLTTPVDVLLVDACQLVRAGIERLLADSDCVSVMPGVSGFDAAIRCARARAPQVLLVNLPGANMNILDGVSKVQRQFPGVQILVLADGRDVVVQERLLQSGIAGIISSSCPVDELYTAIATVAGGERYISDSLAQKLAEKRLSGSSETPFDRLTHRELQILLLVAEGRSMSVIARELCLTQKTVNNYRNRLLEKLALRTEVELMYLALRYGLVSIPGHS
jgi:two-component system invasion response regulator UvrY